jgi:hypothetical protein
MAAVAETALIDQVALGPDSVEWEQADWADFDPVSEPVAVCLALPEQLADPGLSEAVAAVAATVLIDQAAPGLDLAEWE